MVTLYPLAFKRRPREAETIPLPREEVTPPVTKTYFVLPKSIQINIRGKSKDLISIINIIQDADFLLENLNTFMCFIDFLLESHDRLF